MAMYENLGFCPSNSFTTYFQTGERAPLFDKAQKALNLLGDRKGYMVYEGCSPNYNLPYIVDAICGATGTLGLQICAALEYLIPDCKYAVNGRKIRCHDVISPFDIPEVSQETNERYLRFPSSSTVLMEDERYLAGVINNSDSVDIYLYQK